MPVAVAAPPRAVSPRPRAESPTPPPRVTPAKEGIGGGGAARGKLTGAAAKVEQMKREREERRRKAAETKALRAEEAKDAEGRGGIESVEFLRKIKEYREQHSIGEPCQYLGGDLWNAGAGDSRILVCVRKRPMLRVELQKHDFDVISVDPHHGGLVVHEPKTRVDLVKAVEHHRFSFDAVFNEADSNHSIYCSTLQPLLSHVFGGGLATVFAFGQTGSGKTCTMAGHSNHSASDGNAVGLYALAAQDIMGAAGQRSLCVGVSFFEVYRGHVLDLLNGHARLEVLEDGKGRVQVVGLREESIQSADELMGLVRLAEEMRATGATSANEVSSRSHAILQVLLRDPNTGRACGKLYLVDLAGSERAADSASKERQTRLEGAEINKSLLCLKECIRSLDSGSSHTPFRGSKLTQVLRDAFVGGSKTAMIATVSPGSSAAENTLNTLRYAQRVKDFSSKRQPAAVRRLSAAPGDRPAVLPAHAVAAASAAANSHAAHPHTAHQQAAAVASSDTAEGRDWGEAGEGVGEESEVEDGAAEDAAIEQLGQSLGNGQRGPGAGGAQGEEIAQGGEVGDFFKTVAAVTRAEEHLVGEHRVAVEEDEQLLAQEKLMLEELEQPDGSSIDLYATQLERVIGAKIARYTQLQTRLESLKALLANEEALSARVHNVPMY